jgi:putative oxidoreductase
LPVNFIFLFNQTTPKIAMQIVKQLPAYLLALVFIVFGSNYFLHFIPNPPMEGDPATYMGLMAGSGYMTVVKVLEVIIGIMLVLPKTRALAFVLIAPIVVNILLFELLIAKAPGIGVVLLVLNIAGLYLSKDKYEGILS